MNAMHNAPASDPSLVYPSPLKEFWQAFAHNKGALGGLLFMLLIVFCALFAPGSPLRSERAVPGLPADPAILAGRRPGALPARHRRAGPRPARG